MKIGDKIKNFTLQGLDEQGEVKEFSFSDFEGQNVVLYLYPKDETPGCTCEANDFNNAVSKLKNKAVVIGASTDSIESHKKFHDKHNLNFILLSDPEHKLEKTLESLSDSEVYNRINKHFSRTTYLADEKGHLKKVWANVKVDGHVDEVLHTLETMQHHSHEDKFQDEPHRNKHS